jgi:hypothetical protein
MDPLMTALQGTGKVAANAFLSWWFSPVPKARIAVFRTAAYLFIPLDVLLLRPVSSAHASATSLYQPLIVGRLLHLPHPTGALIEVLRWALLILSVAAATGRLPRLLGVTVALLYFEWIIIAFSFGKVDHDRFAYLVALAVLPTVGKAAFRDRTPSEAAGWAMRCVQIGVVVTYFLAAWAKVRFGGWGWVNSATLVRAVLRRGTFIADPLLHHAELLHWAQWGIMAFEFASPVILFVRPRYQYPMVVGFVLFHLSVLATITIMFWPHVLCLIFCFLPTERLVRGGGHVAAPDGRTPSPDAAAVSSG